MAYNPESSEAPADSSEVRKGAAADIALRRILETSSVGGWSLMEHLLKNDGLVIDPRVRMVQEPEKRDLVQ
jgi:hypothetical protein